MKKNYEHIKQPAIVFPPALTAVRKLENEAV